MYTFGTQYVLGLEAEACLDHLFGQWFTIKAATREQQRQGIDRLWRSRKHGRLYTVEYKLDRTAASTGNAWVEVQSSDRSQGWAITSQARWLVYHVPGRCTYLVAMERLRQALPAWLGTYEQRPVHNNGYVAIGVLVPLVELQQISTWTSNNTETTNHDPGN